MSTRSLACLTCGLLLASSVSASENPFRTVEAKLEYSGPETLKDADMSSFGFRKWKPGDLLFVASHDSNLRSKANAKSKVVTKLPMATQVVVRKVAGGSKTVIGKVDRWYQVEVVKDGKATGMTGYLFGLVLTPAAWQVDLDGDGELEIVTAAFLPDFKIRIRIREPKVSEPTNLNVDVDSAGGAYLSQRGGMADVKIVPKQKAGVGLVEVFAHVEACADFATHWVSYQVPGNKPGLLGEAKLAMSQSGISDSPVHSRYEVTFDPKTKTAKSVQTNSESDEEGKETVSKEAHNYRLEAGVYKEIVKKKL